MFQVGVSSDRGAHHAVLEHGGGDRLQVVEGQLGREYLEAQHLALLGDLDAPLEGAGSAGPGSPGGGAAAPSHRSAPAVEDAQGDAVGIRQRLQRDLGPVDLPVAGEEAGILVAVGIAQHHLLQGLVAIAVADQQLAVEGIGEQPFHHRGGPLQILHRLEQGDHQQGRLLGHRIHQTGFLRQQHHLQQVGDGVTHGDHIGAADAAAELLLQPLQHPEHSERLGGGGAPAGRRRQQGRRVLSSLSSHSTRCASSISP